MSGYSFDGHEYDLEYSDYAGSFFYEMESDGAFIEYETEGYEGLDYEASEDRGEFEGHYASIENESFETEAFEEEEKKFLRSKKRKTNAEAEEDQDKEENEEGGEDE